MAKTPKVRVQDTVTIQIDVYQFVSEAVESGVRYGLLRRCDEKLGIVSLETEKEETAVNEISKAVMDALSERLRLEKQW